MLHGAHHSFGLGQWDIGLISISPSIYIYIYIYNIAWTIETVPKHCFKKVVYLCLIEMKRELHRTTKYENA